MKLVLIDENNVHEDVTSITTIPEGLAIQGTNLSMEIGVSNPVSCEDSHTWEKWQQYVIKNVKFDGKLWHTTSVPMQSRHCRVCNFEQREPINGVRP